MTLELSEDNITDFNFAYLEDNADPESLKKIFTISRQISDKILENEGGRHKTKKQFSWEFKKYYDAYSKEADEKLHIANQIREKILLIYREKGINPRELFYNPDLTLEY